MYSSVVLLMSLAIVQVSSEPIKPVHLKDAQLNEGSSGGRIVSGWTADAGQFPYQASLRMVSAVGTVTGCGGSVIHRSWVLSSAHCTVNQITAVVRAGVSSLLRPEYILETLEWYDYPGYNAHDPSVQPNDLALLKLQEPLTYSENLQPIRVQSRVDAHRNYGGEQLIATGFGRTSTNGPNSEVLQWVYLRGVTNLNCLQTFHDPVLINANAICAGFYNVTSQSTCQGDSGGPLVHVDADGIPTVVGVASFVAGEPHGCHSGIPAGFYRPGPFQDWFYEATGIDFENFELEEEDSEEEDLCLNTPTTTTTPAPGESEEDSSSEELDPELEELLKKLIVKVAVKVKVNDKIKKKVRVESEAKL